MKLRSYLAAAAMKLGLPADIAAGLPHMEVNGFQECSIDRHTGILEYNEERIVIGLNIGCLVVTGHALQIQRMHRERLTITGRITCARMPSRTVSISVSAECCEDMTIVSTRKGFPSESYSTVTWLFPSGRRYGKMPFFRTSVRRAVSLCARLIGRGISSFVSLQAKPNIMP